MNTQERRSSSSRRTSTTRNAAQQQGAPAPGRASRKVRALAEQLCQVPQEDLPVYQALMQRPLPRLWRQTIALACTTNGPGGAMDTQTADALVEDLPRGEFGLVTHAAAALVTAALPAAEQSPEERHASAQNVALGASEAILALCLTDPPGTFVEAIKTEFNTQLCDVAPDRAYRVATFLFGEALPPTEQEARSAMELARTFLRARRHLHPGGVLLLQLALQMHNDLRDEQEAGDILEVEAPTPGLPLPPGTLSDEERLNLVRAAGRVAGRRAQEGDRDALRALVEAHPDTEAARLIGQLLRDTEESAQAT